MQNLTIKQVKRGRISDQIVVQLRDLIKKDVLKPGDKIPGEYELAQRFSTSRPSMREALRTLETMGLVEIKSGSGSYVASSPWQSKSLTENLKWLVERRSVVLKVLEVREVLQGLAARSCAVQITDLQLEALADTLNEMSQARDRNDADAATEADTRFHYLIGEYSGNEILNDIIQNVEHSYRSSSRALMDLGGRAMTSVLEHTAIIKAIKAQNGALAEENMRKHIASVRADIAALGEE
ncbi:MAG: FadR family transcriptional regulator [Anaerolineae bacterium]|nr:FadR family transcriptional regulator [Anaerolineae bacterium]